MPITVRTSSDARSDPDAGAVQAISAGDAAGPAGASGASAQGHHDVLPSKQPTLHYVEPMHEAATAGRGRTPRPVPRARRCPTCKQTFSGDSRFCPFDGDPLADAPDWNPAADPLLNRTVDGRYEVLSVVGEGGMGTVYEVRHRSLGRLFAMKVLRRDIAQDAELVARFIQEAKAAAAIGHPNIVAVSDFGALEVEPGQPELPFFVMEFLTGTSLASLLQADKTLPAERVGRIMLQCAAALAAAHAAGVIHRDLKPDNIFLVRNGDQEFVKLLDFGVAKINGGKRLTRVGMVFGTPHYMSPEQAEGKRIDARADVYALGIIMYECFAGHVPFEADTYMGVLTKHMYMTPDPIERVVPDVSQLGAFGPLVMRCLAKSPEERFASMTELAAAIELALEGKSHAAAAPALAERPLREPLRLRAQDEILGPVQVPEVPAEPLPPWVRVGITVAAIVVPIALAYGFRAYRASREPPPPSLPELQEEARSKETAEPPVPAAAQAGTTPTAAPPSATISTPSATPVAVPEPKASAHAKPTRPVPTASTAPPTKAPPPPPLPRSEIVDPWER